MTDFWAPNEWSEKLLERIEYGMWSPWEESILGPEFHIGQSYTEQNAKAVCCKLCGSNKFHVGADDYYTAIKCIECGWECCFHRG